MKNAAVARQIAERDYSQKQRDAMDDSDFGDPENQAFPIKTAQDVIDAASRLHNASGDQTAIKARIKRIAKRKGFPLPKTWQEEDKPKESATPFQPKLRIARIKSYFLEDDAISLNGRQYPREAVDRLIQSAQLAMSDPNALPLTCYLSHDDADKDVTRSIAGKITHVNREGHRAYAMIDIPDTSAGRDVLALVRGGYIRSQSLRASNAEMRVDHERTFPQVAGTSLKLEGIDFTTSPGLPQVARIADVVMESQQHPQAICEVFNAHPSNFLLEEAGMPTINEDGITAITSGNSVGMTDGDPRDDYSKRQYPIPPDAPHDVFPASLSDVHDHIATAIGMDCAPHTMERAASLRFLGITEAGAKFSAATKKHLVAAHNGVANHLGMACASNSTGNDGMQDSDDDDQPPAKETKKPMTPEEAARLLAEAGYKVEPPKTPEQLLQEKFDAMQTAFDQKLAEMGARMAPAQPAPQRRSLVEGANVRERPKRPYYRNGDYLREKLLTIPPEQLADRSCPLPDGVDVERLLKEYELVLMGTMFEKFGLPGSNSPFSSGY